MKFEARSHANCLKTRWIALALVAMILGGHALIAFAQPKQVEPKKTGGYPVRPIRFIVPYAVGGNGDIVWQGILAPARAPKDIIAQLNREIGRLLVTKEVKEQMYRQGVDAWSSTPEQFGAYLQSEIAKWGKVVKATGARVD